MMRTAAVGRRSGRTIASLQVRRRTGLPTVQFLHSHVGGPLEDRREKERRVAARVGPWQLSMYHTTAPSEKAVAIVLGLGTVSALAYAGSNAMKAYNEYKASLPSEEEMEEMRKQQEEESEAERQQREAQAQAEAASQKEEAAAGGGTKENIFSKWFGVGVGAKYYEGGFEDTMTRREAALILGVRESSPASRIKDAHRKLLVLNHPDTGGSTFVAGKINEAKELLLKGKRGK